MANPQTSTLTFPLTIDGREAQAPAGTTLLEVARGLGIYIPTLCHHPHLRTFGTCRVCVVETDGSLVPSCATPVAPGMAVRTLTPQIQEVRREALRFFISQYQHPSACLVCHRAQLCPPHYTCLRQETVGEERCLFCPKNQRCQLQEVAHYVGLPGLQFPLRKQGLEVKRDDPFIYRDYNLCIVCGQCVRVCDEARNIGAVSFTYRGQLQAVDATRGDGLAASGCDFCGSCVEACPTGALMEQGHRGLGQGLAQHTVSSTCPYCGVGCRLRLHVKDGAIVRATTDPQGPASLGHVCVKGRFGLDFVSSRSRLTTPLVRRDGVLSPASWDEALSFIAGQLSRPELRGERFAAIASGKATNEDNYLLQKFCRAVMGSPNIDYSMCLCHSPTLASLEAALGLGAMTNPIQDIGQASCVLALGADPTTSHPIVADEVKAAVRRGAKLLVINPRRIGLCRLADLWLRPRPGADLALVAGLMRFILDEGLFHRPFRQRCQGFEEFQRSLEAYPLDRVARITGIPQGQIVEAARTLGTAPGAAILYGTGITQQARGSQTVAALADLALLTGNLGRPGVGLYPLLGHNNLQGAADMGCLPGYLPGHQPVAAAAPAFQGAWGVPLQARGGLTLPQMMEAAAQGQVRAMIIMGANPALSHPDATLVSRALSALDLLVVQELFLTETAGVAHVVLPAASFAEKDGTFTNMERRVQQVRRALSPPGEAQPDWWILCQLAKRMGAPGFDYRDAPQVLAEASRLAPIYGGILWERLGEAGLHWPCPTPDHPGTPILHADGFHGRFLPLEPMPLDEAGDGEYPLWLTSSRSLYQFNTGSLSGRTAGLGQLAQAPALEVNPEQAAALGLEEGGRVRLTSPRGRIEVQARITEDTPPGLVCLSLHPGEASINRLTGVEGDPSTLTPALKRCPVRLERA